MQPPFKLRNSIWCSVSSLTLIEYSSDQQRLWSDCAYAQACLSLCWSHIPHWRKSHVAAHIFIHYQLHQQAKYAFYDSISTNTMHRCWLTSGCIILWSGAIRRMCVKQWHASQDVHMAYCKTLLAALCVVAPGHVQVVSIFQHICASSRKFSILSMRIINTQTSHASTDLAVIVIEIQWNW